MSTPRMRAAVGVLTAVGALACVTAPAGAQAPPNCWANPGGLRAPPGKTRNLGAILRLSPSTAGGGQTVDVTLPCGYNLNFQRQLRPNLVVLVDASRFFTFHSVAIGYRMRFTVLGPYRLRGTVPPVGNVFGSQIPAGNYVASIGNGPFQGFGVWSANTVQITAGGGDQVCTPNPNGSRAPPGVKRRLGGILTASPTSARGGQTLDVTLPCNYNLSFTNDLLPSLVVFARASTFFSFQLVAVGYRAGFQILGPWHMRLTVPPVGPRAFTQMPPGTYVISIGDGPFRGFGVWTANTVTARP